MKCISMNNKDMLAIKTVIGHKVSIIRYDDFVLVKSDQISWQGSPGEWLLTLKEIIETRIADALSRCSADRSYESNSFECSIPELLPWTARSIGYDGMGFNLETIGEQSFIVRAETAIKTIETELNAEQITQ